MTYEEHIESVIEVLRKYSKDEAVDYDLLTHHLKGIIEDIKVDALYMGRIGK